MRQAGSAVLLLLLGCNSSNGSPSPKGTDPVVPPPGTTQPGQPFKEGIELADSQLALDSGVLSTRFNFAHLRDLWVRVKVSGMPRMGQLDLQLTDPNGRIGYEANALFSPDPAVNQTNVPGAAHPITVYRAKTVPGGFVLDCAIPISGGVLTRFMTPGTWVVQAQVQDAGTFTKQIDVSTTF